MDVTRLTEEEQIALAIQMSMSQAESSSSLLNYSRLNLDANDVEMKEETSASAANTQQASKVNLKMKFIDIFLFFELN